MHCYAPISQILFYQLELHNNIYRFMVNRIDKSEDQERKEEIIYMWFR